MIEIGMDSGPIINKCECSSRLIQ